MIFRSILLLVLVSFSLGALVLPVEAAIPEVYTNDNFFTAEHDTPKAFWLDTTGNFRGVTRSGKQFTQQRVVSDIHVHLHSFSIDEARFYISSLGIIMADNDTVALSIYLARAGWVEVA